MNTLAAKSCVFYLLSVQHMYRLRASKVYKILIIQSHYVIATQITVKYFEILSYRSLWKMYVETSVKKIPVLVLRLFSLMLVRVTAVCVLFQISWWKEFSFRQFKCSIHRGRVSRDSYFAFFYLFRVTILRL